MCWTRGARGGEGLHLALNIAGMLIAFLALIAMLNGILGWVHGLPGLGWIPQSLQQIFGIIFFAAGVADGVSWKDAAAIGPAGTRLVFERFVAFMELGQ